MLLPPSLLLRRAVLVAFRVREQGRDPRSWCAPMRLHVFLTQASRRSISRAAYCLARHDQLNSSVHLASGGVIVCCYRLRVAKAFRGDRSGGHPLIHQVITHGRGAVFGKPLIGRITADTVRKSVHFNIQPRVSQQDTRDFRKLLPRTGL